MDRNAAEAERDRRGARAGAAVRADVTLADLVRDDRVAMDVLHDRYGPVMELARGLLGVVPNCLPYMEIWPPALRAYNVMVPNLLNVPFLVFGVGASPRELVGLGMTVASRTAGCGYCSAHSCSFALRRGTAPATVARALAGDRRLTQRELATIAVARSLAEIPCVLSGEERAELRERLTPAEAEWVVMAIVMMGFLNKFMDGLGVELEQSMYSEVATMMGRDWSPGVAGADLDPAVAPTRPPSRDSLALKLRLVPRFPAAVKLDRRWQRGVPSAWPAVGTFLRGRTGHDFPVLSNIASRRCIRAIATMLRDALDPATTAIGLRSKVLAGLVFAAVVDDAKLAAQLRRIGAHNALSDAQMSAAARYARGEEGGPPLDATRGAILRLAREASPSPARVSAQLLAECRDARLSSAAVVEIVTWLSVLQMLHRLCHYYDAGSSPRAAAETA